MLGPYRVVRELGAGGMGTVYEVVDPRDGRHLALKKLTSLEPDQLYRLKREFRALAGIAHPNLITLHDLVVEGELCFFTMELVDGVELLRHVQTPRGSALAYDDARLRGALRELALALSAIHRAGLIHRDVKPSNVMVNRDGFVIVLDFGLVTPTGKDQSMEGTLVGTVPFMPPEQVLARPPTPAWDWYSFGVTLFQALTRRLPFEGGTLEVLDRKLHEPAPSPRTLGPAIADDLASLCEALLDRDPERRPGGPEVLRRLGWDERGTSLRPAPATSFTSRGAELQVLLDAFDRVGTGGPVVVDVRGEPGLGKTELITELGARLRRRAPRALVLSGRCQPSEALAFRALDPLIDHLTHHWLMLPELEGAMIVPYYAGLLARLFPVLSRVPAIASAPPRAEPRHPRELRDRGIAALRELMQRLASIRQVVLVLDDAHGMDADTAEVLAEVLRAPDAPGVLLVLARHGQDAPVVDGLLRRLGAPTVRLDLGPLDEPEARALATELLGAAAAPAVVEAIVSQAGGRPVFIAELAQACAAGRPARGLRLDDVLIDRVDELEPKAREVLEVIAVGFEPLPRDVVVTAAELPVEQFNRAFRVLLAGRLVVARRVGRDELFEPAHRRVTRAVQSRMSPEAVRSRHAAVAAAWVRAGRGAADRIALHWHAAGEPAHAVPAAIRAARDASEALRFDRAARFLALALELEPDHAAAATWLRELGEARSSSGEPRAAAEAFSAAADRAEPVAALDLRRRSAEELLRGGYVEDGLAMIEPVLRELGRPPARAASVGRVAMQRAWLRLRGLGHRRTSAATITPARLIDADTCYALASGLGLIDPLVALAWQNRFLLAALRIGDDTRVAMALSLEASFVAGHGDDRRARRLLAAAAAFEDPLAVAYARLCGASVAYFRQSWSEALDGFDAAEGLFRELGRLGGLEIDKCHILRIQTMRWVGELSSLAELAARWADDARARGDRFAEVSLRTRSNLTWLVAGDPARAAAELEDAAQRWPTCQGFHVQHLSELVARCEIALYRGQASEAARHFAVALPALERSGLLRITNLRLDASWLGLRIALARRDVIDQRRWTSSLRGVRGQAAGALLALAAACARVQDGTVEDAVPRLRHAIELLDGARLALYAFPARLLLGRLVGGTEGAALASAGRRWLAAVKAADEPALCAMLVPAA